MKAVILAAGRGSRLQELTAEKPKCLTNIGGHPLIAWQVAALRSAGCQEVTVITGYKAELLHGFGDAHRHNPRWETTNMVQTLLCAADVFTEDVIVSYGDILYGADIAQALSHENGDIVISYDTEWRRLWEARFDSPLSDAETFKIDSLGVIHEIGAKPKSFDEIQGQYMGLLKFSPRGFAAVQNLVAWLPNEIAQKLDMTGLLGRLIEGGAVVRGMPVAGGWCEIDTPHDLRVAQNLFDRNKLSLPLTWLSGS